MNDFSSNENKGLLWNLLLNNGAFNNLSENQLPLIQTEFENVISSLKNQKNKSSLIEINKAFMQIMIQKINQFRQPRFYEPVKELYTNQDIRNQKLDEFNIKVQDAQQNFNDAVKLKTPEEINFSDKKDDEDVPISNMDELIQKTIEERNLEVENIKQKTVNDDNTAKWLNPQDFEKKVSFNEEKNQVIENKTINIHEQINNELIDMEANDNNKFYKLLMDIKENQIEILKLLKQK
jgi:hypothetical protein